jgi:hypothetical protein
MSKENNNKKPLIRKIHIISFLTLLEKLYQDGNDYIDIQLESSTDLIDNIKVITREEYAHKPGDDEDEDGDDEEERDEGPEDIYLNMVGGESSLSQDDDDDDEDINLMDRI